MKYHLRLVGLLLLISCRAVAQNATYPITNYTTRNYGKDFNPTNWAIAQDKRGIIYAANGFRLLEYDGSGWKSYPINKATWILSIAVDSAGIIYAGSQGEFGYFAPDLRGELKYHSLSDSLEINDLNFTNIRKIHIFSEGVAFQADEKLFLYKNGKIRAVSPETSFHTSFIVNDRLFIRERGEGLMEWRDNSLVKIEGSQIFDTTGIFMMLPFGRSERKILIGTQEKGFWLYDPQAVSNSFRRLNTDDERLFGRSMITGGIVAKDGTIAISTMLSGVIVIDTTGTTRAIINTGNGLSDNDVKQLAIDQSQDLWAALNNGISRIDISSQLTVSDEISGITGSINSIIRFEDLLYIGTTTGLFVQSGRSLAEPPFRHIHDISVPVRSLINAGGSLLAGTDAGIFRISGNEINRINAEESYILYYSPELKLLLSGGQKGLTAFMNNGPFSKTDRIKIDGEDIIGITAEKSVGTEPSVFWIGTRYKGVIRLIVKKDLTFSTDGYNSNDGLPQGWVIPSVFNSKTVFETTEGLYGFTSENIVRESVPDSLKNNRAFTKGYFSALPDIKRDAIGVVSFLAESNDKEWICSDNNAGYLDRSDSLKYVRRPFTGIEAGKINTIYPEKNGLCWIGTTDGLFRYDENTTKNYDRNYITLIRKVLLTDNDSAVFLGTKYPSFQKPSLPYKFNSVRLEFSAPFYEYSDKLLYSYRLDGMSSKWSQWAKDNYQEFTKLREGRYTFRVKAINIYGTESGESVFSFDILPPWYRTVPAFLFYGVIAIVLFWLVARLYSNRLKRENIRLEGIVTERTAEVVRQRDEIVEKKLVLEYQKKEIEDSIRYARRIQSAVIPSQKNYQDLIPGSFVFFRPLNIVSGDFYWMGHAGSRIIFTAADCTGHGVPGAFMSMLGVAFLNEIVNKDHITSPDKILDNLRDKVIQALQQQGVSGEARDGMDISLVSIDRETGILEFAGAYNPLTMVRNGEIAETPGDKMPIGIYENMHGFMKHAIALEKGDMFYLFSDGYEDQFGGPDGKKFKSKRLKALLLEISSLPVGKQKDNLEMNFELWKGGLPQVDDIVIVGIRIE